MDDIIVIIVIIIVSGRKEIEILKICILFLNIVSPSLSVPRGNGYSFMDRVGKLFASKHKFSRALRIRR